MPKIKKRSAYLELINSIIKQKKVEIRLDLTLNLAENLKSRPNECPSVVDALVKLLNISSTNDALNLLKIADICFVNVGYPFQKETCTKKFLRSIVKWVPSDNNISKKFELLNFRAKNETNELSYTSQEKKQLFAAILNIIGKWYNGHARLVIKEKFKNNSLGVYYDEFINMHHLYVTLLKYGYIFPKVPLDELRSVCPCISKLFISRGEWRDEILYMQNYRLAELIKNKNSSILANQVIKDIALYDENSYWRYENYIKRCINTLNYQLKMAEKAESISNEQAEKILGWIKLFENLYINGEIPKYLDVGSVKSKCYRIQEIIKRNKGSNVNLLFTSHDLIDLKAS